VFGEEGEPGGGGEDGAAVGGLELDGGLAGVDFGDLEEGGRGLCGFVAAEEKLKLLVLLRI